MVKKEEAAKKAAVRHRQQKRHQATKPSLALAAYAGAYENPAYSTAPIRLRNGKLEWECSNVHGPLEHFHFDTITARQEFMGDPLLEFRLNASGEVAGMKLLSVEFKKQK